jgi:peptidoglycan/LPS O-acetylase OafA/YrhL
MLWARRAFLLGATIVALVIILNPDGYKTLMLTIGLMLMSGHLLVKQQRERSGMLDRVLGDLSYPVYISHIFINECVYENIVHVYMYGSGFAKVFMLNAMFSLAAGVILLTLIVYPIDRYRKRLKVPHGVSVNLSPLGGGR